MKYTSFLILLLSVFISSCKQKNEMSTAVLPYPSTLEVGKGFFKLSDHTEFRYADENEELQTIVKGFKTDIEDQFGFKFGTDTDNPLANFIRLNVDYSLDLDPEGYILTIKRQKIELRAASYAGIFYGFQTLKQLAYLNAADKAVILPVLNIKDEPRFTWRGMHLDVCRHFMPVEDVKKYLDYMSLYKFNKFHWHLTEDQGWRIEIKKYPRLTEVGAWRDETLVGHLNDNPPKYDGIKHGGYYTHEQIRDIVDYAAKRYIEVIPEIEMPGHAKAAIASYPWLGVTGEKVDVKEEWGISPYIYMPSEKTFTFLENVLKEVIELFPSSYIHIGGDEAIKQQWEESREVQELIDSLGLKDEHELQSWFIHRIEKFLNSHNRKIIGWDEILEGGLAPNATVMSWRGEDGGIKAARMGHNAIMSPTSHCYFDYYQAEPVEDEPLAIGGFLPIHKVYSYNPVPEELSTEEGKFILGAQANVWTEYLPDFEAVEYMIFPRMLAMSEVTWTAPENKDESRFFNNVHDHLRIFDILEVNYSVTGMPEMK